jgi:steroid delta-isomerase-like uncharacterized protein
MPSDEQLIEEWFETLFNDSDLSVADEILADEVTYSGPRSISPRDPSTPADIKRYVEIYHRAFPDIEYTVEHVFSEGSEYCVRWRAEGTHESELFGIEATDEAFSKEGLSVFVVEDGRITEVHSQWDTLGMTQELDIMPPLGMAGN